jgi:hypothetical protein
MDTTDIKIGQAAKDYISKQILIKHAYMFEVGTILINSPEANDKMFNEIPILESEIDKKVKEHGFVGDDIGPCLNSLVMENFLELSSPDNRNTMYVRVLEKGMNAISTGYFLKELENRQRDLLQEQLTISTIDTNKNIRRNNRIIATASICTGLLALAAVFVSVLDFRDSEALKPSLEQLNRTLQTQEQQLQQLAPSLREINHSIQSIVDSLPK